MISRLFLPALLAPGAINDRLIAVRDGLVNFYVFKTNSGLLCIDCGFRPSSVADCFAALGLDVGSVAAVLLTHLHWDHAGCLHLFPGAEVFAGAGEATWLKTRLFTSRKVLQRLPDTQELTIGGSAVQAISTPGHTAGSFSYLLDGSLLFTGDTLRLKQGQALPFPAWLNRNNKAVRRSIAKLAGLSQAKSVFTAHSGSSNNLEKSFSAWRTSAKNIAQGGVSPSSSS